MQFMKFVLNYHAGEVRETFFFKLESMIPHGHVTCARAIRLNLDTYTTLTYESDRSYYFAKCRTGQRTAPPEGGVHEEYAKRAPG